MKAFECLSNYLDTTTLRGHRLWENLKKNNIAYFALNQLPDRLKKLKIKTLDAKVEKYELFKKQYTNTLCLVKRINDIAELMIIKHNFTYPFLDYDIDEELPWHSTLSRTRKLFGQEVFVKVFRIALKLCIDKGMVGGRRQAIDSALIKANASMDSLRKREILDDADDYCSKLCEHEDQGQSSQKSNIKKIEKSDKGSLYGEKDHRVANLYPR